jgi:hypothetical protein
VNRNVRWIGRYLGARALYDGVRSAHRNGTLGRQALAFVLGAVLFLVLVGTCRR